MVLGKIECTMAGKHDYGDKTLINVHGLQIKIILPLLVILSLVFFTSSLIIINREYNAAKTTVIENSESYASLSINEYINVHKNYLEGFGFYYLRENFDKLMKLNSELITLQIVDVNGKILFDSIEIEQGEYNEEQYGTRYLEDTTSILRAGNFTSSTIVNESGKYIDIIQPYFDEWDRHDISVRFLFSLAPLDNSRVEMYTTLFFYASIFIIISFFLIYILFNRFITTPIGRLMNAVRQMSEGDLGNLVKVKSRDELGQLGVAFNKLSIDLKRSQDSLKEYNVNLEKLVTKRTEELEDKTDYLEKINVDLEKTKQDLDALNKELEQRIKERTKEVEQLLQQKDDFINQLSHDLKSPLAPLMMLIPILEKQETDGKRKEILQVLKRNIDYMKNIVIKTLQLAKLNSSKTRFNLEKIDLTQEVQRIIQNKKTLFESKKIDVNNNILGNHVVTADKLRLEELFSNLLENAVKYSHENTQITLNITQENQHCTISIHDQGIGMNSDQIEHIFDEFYKGDTARHDFESSGLGMAISKKIIEKHHGKIWVESPGLEKGTTVYFTLPLFVRETKHEKNN